MIVGYHILSVRAEMLATLNTEYARLQCAEAVFDSVVLSVSHSNRQPNNPFGSVNKERLHPGEWKEFACVLLALGGESGNGWLKQKKTADSVEDRGREMLCKAKYRG